MLTFDYVFWHLNHTRDILSQTGTMGSHAKSLIAAPPQWKAALLGLVTMFNVGTVYALSSLQNEVQRLLAVSQPWSYSLFVAASLGLSIGVSICASCMTAYGEYFVAVAGTALWGISVASVGYFLATIPSMLGILGSLFIGGIGVGLTYLATIVLVGRAFPNQPLARSAIGPVGSSSGAGSWFAAWSHFQVSTREAEQLQNGLRIASAFIISTSVISFYLAPRRKPRCLASIFILSQDAEKVADRRFFLILLFCNALPGMAVFGALYPITSLYARKTTGSAPEILPYPMTALALGGFLSSAISNRLGARSAFIMLFCIRGLLLITISLFPIRSVATVTLVVVPFAHGAGFSIIPGLVKALQSQPALFPYEYGRVLTAWGVSGVVGNAIDAAFVPSSGETVKMSFLLGLVTLAFGVTLYSNPVFGRRAFAESQ